LTEQNTLKSFLSLTLTCADVAKQFIDKDIPFFEGNFHVYDYDVYYGDGSVMSAIAKKNSIIVFPKGNLRDFFFKNYTTGSNATIVFTGTVPNWYVNQYTKY